jgi:hypothetical protein
MAGRARHSGMFFRNLVSIFPGFRLRTCRNDGGGASSYQKIHKAYINTSVLSRTKSLSMYLIGCRVLCGFLTAAFVQTLLSASLRNVTYETRPNIIHRKTSVPPFHHSSACATTRRNDLVNSIFSPVGCTHIGCGRGK